jgi:integrase
MNTLLSNKEKITVDEIISYKNFISNPFLIDGKVLAVVKDDDVMFYAVNPALMKTLFKVNSKEYKNINETNQTHTNKHSFVDIFNEWLYQKSVKWTTKHLEEVKRRAYKDLIPFFRDDYVEDITSQDILDFIRRVESRNNYDITHRLYRDIHAVMRYAISIGVITHNIAEPLRGALLPNVVVNQKTITKKELPVLLSQISLAQFSEGKIMNHAFQLLALTFLRAQELMGAGWNEINFEEKIWIIPAERMKMRRPHAVYLTSQMATVLETIKANYFHPTYIFYDKKRDTAIKNERLINSLYKIGYKGKMTAHGFRALASTILNEEGFNSDVIEKQLAHIDSNSVRRAYNRAEYIEDRNKMMQWWSDFIVEQCPTFIETKQATLNL